MAAYRSLLAVPSVTRLLLFAVVARIPPTAVSVVLTLHVVTGLHLGYAAAGLVVMAVTVGMALGSPWQGRAIDRFGLRATLLPLALATAVIWGLTPLAGYGALVALALLGGLLSLPVFTVIRLSLSVLVPPEQRRTAFAMDSIGVEISFMIGPAAGVLVATQLSTGIALISVAAAQSMLGLALVGLNPPTRSTPPTRSNPPTRLNPADRAGAGDASRSPSQPLAESLLEPLSEPAPTGPAFVRGTYWHNPALIAVLGAAAAATLVLGGTDVSIVAALRSHGALSLTGLVFLAWGGGSIIGGLIYGAVRHPPQPIVLLFWLAILTVPVGLAPNPLLLTLTILPAAALCAPVITSTADAVSRLIPEHSRGEAMGWHGAALTVGQAGGAPLAGAVIDATGPWAGFAAVGVLGGLLAAVALGLQRGRRTPVPPARPTLPAAAAETSRESPRAARRAAQRAALRTALATEDAAEP